VTNLVACPTTVYIVTTLVTCPGYFRMTILVTVFLVLVNIFNRKDTFT
jgi:hypothetical protein